jgi:hypothetical protein
VVNVIWASLHVEPPISAFPVRLTFCSHGLPIEGPQVQEHEADAEWGFSTPKRGCDHPVGQVTLGAYVASPASLDWAIMTSDQLAGEVTQTPAVPHGGPASTDPDAVIGPTGPSVPPSAEVRLGNPSSGGSAFPVTESPHPHPDASAASADARIGTSHRRRVAVDNGER